MLTAKVVGVEGGREPACSEFPSTFRVSIVPTQRQFTLDEHKHRLLNDATDDLNNTKLRDRTSR